MFTTVAVYKNSCVAEESRVNHKSYIAEEVFITIHTGSCVKEGVFITRGI